MEDGVRKVSRLASMTEGMKENKDYVSKILENPKILLESIKGDFIVDVTENICEILEKDGIDRKELARRMGKSKGYISQLLNGTRNMTLGTLAEILYHLGYKVSIKCEKRRTVRAGGKTVN